MATSTSPDLPPGVRHVERHGTPAVEVSTPACAAILHRDGAHLTSWIPAGGDDLLWTSAEAVHAEGAAIRGGIPLIGPWFGPGRDGRTSPAHGWLRTHRWDLIAAHRGDSDAGGAVHGDGDVVTLELELRGADPTGQGTSAALAVVLSRESLQVTLTVTAGTEPLVLEAALHTYLAVSDVRAIELEGFAGVPYLDNTAHLARRIEDTEPRIDGEVDRVYETAGPIRLRDTAAGRHLEVSAAGSTRTVLWNPGAAGAAAMRDMPDGDWTRFVCIETAIAKDGYVPLAPGRSHAITATYRITPV